jgi:hypothetical protein
VRKATQQRQQQQQAAAAAAAAAAPGDSDDEGSEEFSDDEDDLGFIREDVHGECISKAPPVGSSRVKHMSYVKQLLGPVLDR